MQFDIKLLEFDKIKELIIRKASTLHGKELVSNISPTNNKLEITRLLEETNHAFSIVTRYKEPPFGGIRDLHETLHKAKIHSVLKPTEFLNVVGLLEATLNNTTFYKNVKEEEIEGDALDYYYIQLMPVKGLKQEINQVITIDGKIYDNASHDLSRIRAKIHTKEQRINDRLSQVLNSQKNKLTENLITLRNDRLVVPVKLSEKNNFKGSIIDYSSSGETVYMEPEAVSQLNNEIQMLRLDEQREIQRILSSLTALVADNFDTLTNNYNVLCYLDMTYAKAKFAVDYECIMPIITEKEINLVKARHPLIDQSEIVPNTIAYNKEERIIIITGPNTGGKTVAIKTMGLLSVMAQSGLLIPVSEGSKTIVFENIFADIGDEQSIEQSLSTFSSHLTRIISILKNMTVGSLILLDELGSGTDPKEGASLAIAILDYVRIRGMYVMATTHYPELKAYAYDKEEIINASVEFNVETLSPTYRLLLGTPGKSNALLISERLGLPEKIITAAKENVLTSQSEISDLINKLERQGNLLDSRVSEYEELISSSKELVSQNEKLKRELVERQNEIKRKAAVSKSQIVVEAQREASELLKSIENLSKQQKIKEHEIADMKYKVKNLSAKEDAKSSTKDHQYIPGDLVTILKFNRIGELMKKQKNKNWIVKMGSMNSQFSEEQFEFVEHKEKEELKSRFRSQVKKSARPELDLRGMRYEEAKYELDKYVDDCIVANMPHASIIHGFGTLTLRKLVKTYLDKHPLVSHHRDGEGGEGGQGCTVFYFK